MDDRSPEMLRPTWIAGAIFGAAAAIPFLNLLNCACCALVWGCGLVAAWLYAEDCRKQGAEFRPATGAIVGLVAGAFYALSQTIVVAVVRFTVGDPSARLLLGAIERIPSLPEESREMLAEAIRRAEDPAVSVMTILSGFFLTVLVAAVFSTLGGLIGGALFRLPPGRPGSADPASGSPG